MRLTDKEISLLLGAVDTLECELGEQNYQNGTSQHNQELKDLDKLSDKLVREKIRREEKRNAKGDKSNDEQRTRHEL